MYSGLFVIAIVALLAVLSHRRKRLEEKVFKNIPLSDWLIILVFPLMLYIGWVVVVRNILNNPRSEVIPIDDFDILVVTNLFMIYGFVGNAIHFTGKILWRYLRTTPKSLVYRVNEIFHGRLSHYLTYLNGLFIFFMLTVLEMNHQILLPIDNSAFRIAILTGIILGVSASKAVFYTNEWFGGYNKPLFFVGGILLLILLQFVRVFSLNLSFYPVTLFAISMFGSFMATFLLRQIFILLRLNRRRRLQFLAKILNARLN